jgi:hypothetical protein
MSGGKKRKLNPYFKKMLAARRAGKKQFSYDGKTYRMKKNKNPKLAPVYKRV